MKPSILLLVALLLSGCYSPSGETLIRYERDGAAHQMLAPEDAEYALYARNDPSKPKRVVNLKRGEPLGFKRYTDGGLGAVAGDKEYPLGPSSYVWKRN